MAQRHLAEPDLDGVGDLRRRGAIFRKETRPEERAAGIIKHIKSRTPLRPLGIVDLAKVKHLPLMHSSLGANAFDNAPIAMLLPVLQPFVASQIHALIFPQKNVPSTGKVCTTACFEKHPPENIGQNKFSAPKKGVFSHERGKTG